MSRAHRLPVSRVHRLPVSRAHRLPVSRVHRLIAGDYEHFDHLLLLLNVLARRRGTFLDAAASVNKDNIVAVVQVLARGVPVCPTAAR